ncbi:MAG: lytic transglycosylase domain-containing protein [Alphaproteobacteria bacterium]|nr:lytic transglycosylase domain-containing protein [Alphaproteobacteria bacterium]
MALFLRLLLVAAALFWVSYPARADTNGMDKAYQDHIIDASLTDTSVAPEVIAKLHLTDKDAETYSKIFAAHGRGDRKGAEALAKKLSDRSLVDWARVRNGHNPAIWLPETSGGYARTYRSPLHKDKAARDAADDIALSVSVLLKTDDIARAIDVTKRAAAVGTIDRIEAAAQYARIAAAYLYANKPADALSYAHLALQIGGIKTPDAAWVAGLASWLQGESRRAAQYFAWVPRSPYAGPWLRSAASFWAARAMMREGQYALVSEWLREAAKNPRSFYGLIATRALGTRFDFNWIAPPFTPAHAAVLKRYPGAVRALKLAQAGQYDMARIELALLDANAAPQWREALAALATTSLKPDTVMKVSGILMTPDGRPLDLAMYPVAPWQPRDGFRLDPALLHAFARQESGFKPAARNKASGATGLLQLMPRTARSFDKSLDESTLKNPQVSLALGQKYLEDLLDMTDGNLFEAAIAYNAGPGNLGEWKDRFAGVDDPLLFIELIPFGETRAYVERVMANYWIYSLRMGFGVASLDAVAAGKPAIYASYTKPRDEAVYASVSSASNR